MPLEAVQGRQRNARFRALVVIGLLIGLLAVPSPARASVTATVDDPRPSPGQTVTVRASGLLPGTDAAIDLLPDAVRLTDAKVGPSGSITSRVQIPPDAVNDAKQIVVTGIGDDGNYAYVPLSIRVEGTTATARLSDADLQPLERFTVTGERFASGGPVSIDLLPDGTHLGDVVVGSDQRFSIEVQLPEVMVNGEHQVVATGPSADGGFGYVGMTVRVTGGLDLSGGSVPPIGQQGTVDLPSTTTTPRERRSSTTVDTTPLESKDDGGPGSGLFVFLIIVALIVAVLVVQWLRSTDGQRWREYRLPRLRRRLSRRRPGR